MYAKYVKRFLDFSLSLMGLLALSPLLFVLTMIGAVVMKGNPFFTQERPGKDEKIFKLIKFRTMTNQKDEKGNLLPDEQRLIPYGRFLRSTSCDELPSLINILKGELAIVGPRPLLVKYIALYNEEQHHRHDVRPGLTGLAQVNGRNAISWEEKFKYDIEYVNHITFFGDMKIMLLTVKNVLKREGIHSETAATVEEFRGTQEKLIIIGASGHGKVIADIAQKNGYKIVGFLDDNESLEQIMGFPVLGKVETAERYPSDYEFVIAIGNNQIRERIAQRYSLKWATLVHPAATIGMDVQIGEGTVVMAKAVVNTSAVIGKHCIINTGSVIEHDNKLADYAQIATNVALAGTVTVGTRSHIGVGACVKNNITITDDAVIGAGAAVVKDIREPGTYVGVPARRMG